MASRPIVINIQGDDSNLRKTLKGAANSVEGFAKKVGALGIKAGAAFGAVSGAVAVGGVKAFSDFQAGMNEVLTLIPEAGAEAFGELGDQVKDFSKEFGVLPEKTIPALYQALSAGVPKDNVFEFLEVAQKAAKGGVTDLETAVDGLSSVINAYGGPAMMDMSRASDLLFTAVKLGKTDFTQLSNSIFQVAPIASAIGVPFENLTAAFANLTAQGVPTSVAATQMKGALAELAKQGSKADTAFRDLNGVGLQGFLENGGTFEEALITLKDGADAAGISVLDMFGSVEAGQAILALTSDGGDKFSETLEAMGDSAGATTTAFNTMDSGLAANLDKIKANLKVLSIEVGEKLAPFIERFTDALVTGFGNLDKHLGTARDTAIDVAKKIKEKAVPILEGIADTFNKVADAALAVYDAVYEYLAPGIEELYGKIETLVRDGLEKIVEVFERIQWGEVFDTLATAAENARARVMEFVRDVPNKMREAKDQLLGIIDELNKKIDSFRAFIKRNADQLLLLAGAIGGLVVALGIYKISLIVAAGATAAWSAITTAATAVGLAFVAVQVALASPLIIVIGLLAAVAGALVVAYFRFEEVREIIDNVARFFMDTFWPMIRTAIELIINIIKTWVSMFIETAKMIKNLISGDFQGAFDNLKNLVGIAVDAVVAFFTALPGKLLATLPALILGLFKIYRAFYTYIFEKIGDIVDKVVGFFLDLPGRLLAAGIDIAATLVEMGIDFGKKIIEAIVEGLRRAGGAISSYIMSLVPDLGSIVSSIVDGATSAAKGVLGGVGGAIGGVFGFSEGGIVTKPTLGVIAEAGEAEAVIPLSKMGQMGGITVNIHTGVGDPVAIGDEIVSALTAWERSNGAIPLTTSAA